MIKLFVVLTIFMIALELEPASGRQNCVDKATNCKVQLQHKNYCKHEDAEIRKFFLEQCQKSCGSCEDSSTGSCKSCNCWTCLNGGTCTVKSKNPTCKCPSGYSGSHCHFTESNVCNPNPCKNGGTCTVAKSQKKKAAQALYTCSCTEGFTGQDCEIEPCVDISTKCDRFVPKFCTKNKMVMENCKASCGICVPSTPSPKYPSTATTSAVPTTEAQTSEDPTTTLLTTGYPSTPKPAYPTTAPTTKYPSTPLRRLCSARMMNRCRCGCKNAGPAGPKVKCSQLQKKMCPCKCNNL